MAGNYPDSPSWRMAYDRDGTQAVIVDVTNGTVGQYTSATLALLNNETAVQSNPVSYSNAPTAARALCLIFPELRDLDAIYAQAIAFGMSLQVSTNTTNGLDGTWTSLMTYTPRSALFPGYRTDITSSTALAIRAVRMLGPSSTGYTVNHWHVYGEAAPGENLNRLELWHPTLNEKLPPAYLDWGDVPRSSSADRLFRVKNLSATQTAGAVRVAMDVLTDGSPSVPAQHTLSYGGGSFLAQVTLGDLSPGAISGPVTIRRITPSNAVLSLWVFRVFAESTNWT